MDLIGNLNNFLLTILFGQSHVVLTTNAKYMTWLQRACYLNKAFLILPTRLRHPVSFIKGNMRLRAVKWFFQGHTAVKSLGQHPGRHLPGHGSIFLFWLRAAHDLVPAHLPVSATDLSAEGLGQVAADTHQWRHREIFPGNNLHRLLENCPRVYSTVCTLYAKTHGYFQSLLLIPNPWL